MTYSVKEVFLTLQGEGAQCGRRAVFCRFTGCNLWSGREVDRDRAICRFCDTDFVGTDGQGGGRFANAESLADQVERTWGSGLSRRFVVCTGGEPALQLDAALVEALHDRGFEIAVETNGTLSLPDGIDWVCVSPKATSNVVQRSGSELKLAYPQAELSPDAIADWNFSHYFLQPIDGPSRERNARLATEYCLANPQWRLSVQVHKALGLP